MKWPWGNSQAKAQAVRDRSWACVRSLGLPTDETLPEFSKITCSRDPSAVLDRLFVLQAVTAVAYGFSADRAKTWLRQEGLEHSVGPDEQRILDEESKDYEPYQQQVEAMWALFWYLGLTPTLDPTASCSDSFASEMPDLRPDPMPSTLDWRARSRPRQADELLEAMDVAHCLAWAFAHARSLGRPTPQLEYGLWVDHRARAFAWLTGDGDWTTPTAARRKWRKPILK
ncbi:DUF4272 domain-containing protein [Brevundimonas poindexterae]|uniref:DUF4272 domain-containing protein n=1 Tax=Brevundimonas poindexterae TaxID=74325 RepID=UPI001CFE16EE|nr:DUF4272 domain-containing protein [Brevundimonas poindexterae]